jgi:hypothetical protein
MRKTFPLTHPRHEPPQVVAGIKNEVRKYIKRERGKKLPEGADFLDFDCKVGKVGPENVTHVGDIVSAIDAAFAQGWPSIYIEILAKPATRRRKSGEPEA